VLIATNNPQSAAPVSLNRRFIFSNPSTHATTNDGSGRASRGIVSHTRLTPTATTPSSYRTSDPALTRITSNGYALFGGLAPGRIEAGEVAADSITRMTIICPE
jgi:hypothetical protein